MLNYKELSRKFDEALSRKTREDIEAWLRYDEARESIAIIRNKIPIKVKTGRKIVRPKAQRNLQFHAGFFILIQPATFKP